MDTSPQSIAVASASPVETEAWPCPRAPDALTDNGPPASACAASDTADLPADSSGQDPVLGGESKALTDEADSQQSEEMPAFFICSRVESVSRWLEGALASLDAKLKLPLDGADAPIPEPCVRAQFDAALQSADGDDIELAEAADQADGAATTAHTEARAAVDEAAPQISRETARCLGGAPTSTPCAGLSEYELERLRNIAENQAALAALGLADPVLPTKFKPPSKARKHTAPAPPPPPRSNRVLRSRAKPEPSEAGADAAACAAEVDDAAEEEGPAFDHSKVLRYFCTAGVDASAGCARSAADGMELCRATEAAEGRLVGWRRTAEELSCPAELSKVYSFTSRPAAEGPPLLAAAGHAGWTVIWPLACFGRGEQLAEPLEPLLSFQAHTSWLGELQFLKGSLGDTGGAKLLTSSNDGSIRLWDLARSSPRGPLRLGSHEVHARTSGGIFAMHEVGLRVLTASKDHTVALTQLRADGGAEVVTSFDGIHGGAVRSVRWGRGAQTFASGATTGDIVLSDTRAPAQAEAAAMRRSHGSAINTLAWCGAAEHVLLSSSCDATMLLHDVRKPSSVLATLVGHTRLPRQKAINQPTFCDGGRFVVSVGEGSPHLSLFCARTGELLSQGELGDHVLNKKGSCLHALGPSDDEALVLANGNVLLAFLPERAP